MVQEFQQVVLSNVDYLVVAGGGSGGGGSTLLMVEEVVQVVTVQSLVQVHHVMQVLFL